MLILLPPSEGKRAPASGPGFDPQALSHRDLNPARARVLDALIATSGRPDAAQRLGVPACAAAQIAAHAQLRDAVTAPAAQVYDGVLYAALAYDTLPPDARRRAGDSVRIFSALFGILVPDDPIPAYRLSADARLDAVGTPKTFWRRQLAGHLVDRSLVIDARSGPYAAMWNHPDALRVRVFTVKDGRRVPVSHWAKQARGWVARALLLADAEPADVADAVAVINDWCASASLATAGGVPLTMSAQVGDAGIDVLVR